MMRGSTYIRAGNRRKIYISWMNDRSMDDKGVLFRSIRVLRGGDGQKSNYGSLVASRAPLSMLDTPRYVISMEVLPGSVLPNFIQISDSERVPFIVQSLPKVHTYDLKCCSVMFYDRD